MNTDILKKYDLNIYVASGFVSLVAYKQRHQALTVNGKERVAIETDTANYSVLPFPMVDEYYDEVAYLLNNPQWNEDGLS